MCVTIYTRSYITHFNHTTPDGNEEKGLWEHVHASNKYGWKDGQKKERVRARIKWLLVYIKRKTKRIKGIESLKRVILKQRNKRRKVSVKWRQVIVNTQMGFKDDQQ